MAVENINERISPTYEGPPEPTYCSGSLIFGGPNITVSGKAQYEYRELVYTSTFRGLGHVPKDEDENDILTPIRYAEVVILDSQNNIVQCGETDQEGDYNLTLPRDGALYRVRILSRGLNDAQVRASVLRSPESNQLYFVEKVITADNNKVINLLAKATGTLEGGAFHIFDQILKYNEKLRELVGTCNTGSYTGCTPFTAAPKVNIYWEKGFNPGTYLPGSPISSFYYQGTNRIFLLGGVDGDVDYSDTDHFDRSIIAHEYFHFLEATMGKASSPGGAHNGNQIIDPRLAWSEGAAQYFQGVMTGIARVMDSRGNISGASALVVDFSIEIVDTDMPVQENEGEFREFSVARVLWDSYDDSPGETDSPVACSSANIENVNDKCAKNGFHIFWSALTGNNGFKHNNHAFVSASLMHHLQGKLHAQAPDPSINWNPLRNYERQAHDRFPSMTTTPPERVPFGARLINCTGSPHWFTMRPPFLSPVNPAWHNSHLVTNNNFLYFYHSGGALYSDIIFQFSGGIDAEINYILYRDNFYLYDNDDIVGHDTIPSGTYPTYSINIADLPAGNYMMNVNVIHTNGTNGQIDYNIRNNGVYLCPEE
ncbi:MAG: hypothetical protein M9899_01825 [Bdellovibrionaceae bacterium]|nr:hypothetical protein [Pseudobdellovibrionaceae bacterium]